MYHQIPMTKEQQRSTLRLWNNSAKHCPKCYTPIPKTHPISYLAFRRKFRLYDYLSNKVVGSYFGGAVGNIFIGIERDGYTHS